MFVVTLKGKMKRKLTVFLVTMVVLLSAVSCFLFDSMFCSREKTVRGTDFTYSTELAEKNSAESFALQFEKETGEMYCEKTVLIPDVFNKTYLKYNELQKTQGLDLEKYKGKQCTLFVYEIKNFTVDYEKTYLTLLVYRDCVIGGHISTLIKGDVLYNFFGEEYGEI